MMNSMLHSALFRYTNRPTRKYADALIFCIRNSPTIHPDDAYRIFHDIIGLDFDAEIKSALDATPTLAHPSQR